MNLADKGASTNTLQVLLDTFVIIAALGLAIRMYGQDFASQNWEEFIFPVLIFTVVFALANKSENIYNLTTFCEKDWLLKTYTVSFLLATGTAALMVMTIGMSYENLGFYRLFLAVAYVLLMLKIMLIRPLLRLPHNQYTARTAFLGDKDKFPLFQSYLNKTSIPYDDMGYIAETREQYEAAEEAYIGCAEDLENLIREYNIDQIYIGQDSAEGLPAAQKYLDLCVEMGVTVGMVIDFYNRRFAKTYVNSIGTYPVVFYHTVVLDNVSAMWKRTLDILGGLVGVILSSPIMLLTAIAIKLDSPGPAIFKQTRVGKNGRQFEIYKVRSMYLDAEARKQELMAQNEIGGGVMFKIRDDPRITKVGRIIRKLSIDELPQFFNVLEGSMSLVGTRPPTLDEVEKYKTNQWRRISIKPGITGMWQVNGRSNIQDFDEIVKLDVDYIDNWSLWLDLKIIFKTVLVLLKHDDAC